MSETTDKPKLGTRAPLGLKRTVETGKVKQSFSHGRSNTVVVEVKKRRILGPPGGQPEAAAAPAPEAPTPAASGSPPPPPGRGREGPPRPPPARPSQPRSRLRRRAPPTIRRPAARSR